jgi:hypothetical protein
MVLTHDQIDERFAKMREHLDSQVNNGSMTKRNYNFALADLHRWAQLKRQELAEEEKKTPSVGGAASS